MQDTRMVLENAVKGMEDLTKYLEKSPVKPRATDLHAKAVAKRKKQKRGGHK